MKIDGLDGFLDQLESLEENIQRVSALIDMTWMKSLTNLSWLHILNTKILNPS